MILSKPTLESFINELKYQAAVVWIGIIVKSTDSAGFFNKTFIVQVSGFACYKSSQDSSELYLPVIYKEIVSELSPFVKKEDVKSVDTRIEEIKKLLTPIFTVEDGVIEDVSVVSK